MARRFRALSALLPTEQEKAAAATAASAPQQGAGWGSGIGSAVGAGLGALGFLGGPALGIPLMGVGAGLGGTVGGLAGQAIGSGFATDAEKILSEEEKKRQRQIQIEQERQAKLDALMRTA